MFPPKMERYLFGFFVSGMMSFLVSGVATFKALGPAEGFLGLWLEAWVFAWAVAFPTIIVVGPFAMRLVKKLIKNP